MFSVNEALKRQSQQHIDALGDEQRHSEPTSDRHQYDEQVQILTNQYVSLKAFVRAVIDQADTICQSLHQRISILETKNATCVEQARETIMVLQTGSQIESCDEAVRAVMDDAIHTLQMVQ